MSWSDDFVPTDDERIRLIRREDAGSIPAVLMVPDGTPSLLRELSTTPSGRVRRVYPSAKGAHSSSQNVLTTSVRNSETIRGNETEKGTG